MSNVRAQIHIFVCHFLSLAAKPILFSLFHLVASFNPVTACRFWSHLIIFFHVQGAKRKSASLEASGVHEIQAQPAQLGEGLSCTCSMGQIRQALSCTQRAPSIGTYALKRLIFAQFHTDI